MNAAGLIFDSSPHYLDHLAPLCALLDWPLVVIDPDLFETARLFYPDVKLLDTDLLGLGSWLAHRFETIVSCTPAALLSEILGPTPFFIMWLPHGNSDKGNISSSFQALQQEECALIYGQKMRDMLTEQQLNIPTIVRIGAFRRLYHSQRHSSALPFEFSTPQRTILYAPTWEDAENNCTFWNALPLLAKRLPSSINLIVKPHPNTIAKETPKLERLIGKTERGNLQFLIDYPPIYPLLKQCDAYLGDRSSIGYDFLSFNRPLYFINPHDDPRGRDLLACGTSTIPDSFFEIFEKGEERSFSTARKRMFSYTFDDVSHAILRTRILEACHSAYRRGPSSRSPSSSMRSIQDAPSLRGRD